MNIAILGPSHALQLRAAIDQKELNPSKGVYVKGFQSAPVFVEPILREAQKCSHCGVIYLYVISSMRFNFLYKSMSQRIFVSTEHYEKALDRNPFLFSRDLMKSQDVVGVVDQHLQKWLNYYSVQFPQVRFIFWCEFVTRWKKSTSHHKHKGLQRFSYKDWVEKNPNHVDLDDFVESTGLTVPDLLKPKDNHKNRLGRRLFLEYLVSDAGLLSSKSKRR